MRLIHRYVLREILVPALIGLLAYTSVLMMNRVFQLVDLAIRKSIPAGTILLLIAYALPRLLALTLPMAVLLGVLVGIGRLATDSEVVALRAGGIGRSAFLLPVLAVSVPAAALCALDLVWVEPYANHRAHLLYARSAREAEAARRILPGSFYDLIPGTVLYAMGAAPETNELTRLILYRRLEDESEEITLSARGRIGYDQIGQRIVVELGESSTHTFPPDRPEDYQSVRAASRQVALPASPALRARLDLFEREAPKGFSELSLSELLARYREAGKLPQPEVAARVRAALRTILHEKLAIPAVCIVFGLFAAGLGLRVRRGGKTSGFAVSTLVIIAFWTVYTTGRNFSSRGLVSPAIGLWSANLAFALGAGFLLLLRDRPRERRHRGGAVPRRGTTAAESPESSGAPGPYSRPAPLTLLDRYVLGYFLRAFLFIFLTLYFLFFLVEFRELADPLIENGQPFVLLFGYSWNRLPWAFHQILPMATLIGCVTALGLLTRNLETTALQSAGVSLYRIAAPVILAGVVLGGFSYLLQDHVLPVTNRRATRIKDSIRQREPRSYGDPTAKWLLVRDRELVHYRNFRRGPEEFQGVSLYRFDPETFRLQARGFAQRGRWIAGIWHLEDGWWRDLAAGEAGSSFERFGARRVPDPDFPKEIFTAEVRFPFSLLPDSAKRASEQLSFPELREYIGQLRRGNFNVQELRVALQTKLSFPMIPVVLAVIGVPFAFRAGRRGTMVGLGLSLLLVLVYYACFAVSTALGNAGYLPPFLAAWGPNLLFSTGAVHGLARLRS